MKRWPLLIFLTSLLFSCAKTYRSVAEDYAIENGTAQPDYARLDYWAAHPQKKDPSDSVVADLQYEIRDTIADVFFIHPTTYIRNRESWNADINNATLNAKTDYTTILYQASVFNQHCRVFAPRYRQAHYRAFFIPAADSRPYFDEAYDDIKNAFAFYLENENRGRPIVIAGHSQGALLAERLLKEFFDGKPLQKQLVAAYIIGWPIPQNEFARLPVCTDPLQTGCFCGWRTLKKGYMPRYMRAEKSRSFVTNPISWKTDSLFVPRSQNKGSVLKNYRRLVPHTTGAAIHEGVLWVNRPRFLGSVFFRARNYHIADMNLFYLNLRTNVEQRLHAFSGHH